VFISPYDETRANTTKPVVTCAQKPAQMTAANGEISANISKFAAAQESEEN
jgi:hypothetical protein